MKRGFLGGLIILAAAALAVCSTVAVYAGHAVVATCRAVKDLVLDGFNLLAPAEDARTAERPLVQAKAFVQRIMKRERPTVTPGWRMCPSI